MTFFEFQILIEIWNSNQKLSQQQGLKRYVVFLLPTKEYFDTLIDIFIGNLHFTIDME